MKLISLNTWGGKEFTALIQFIKKHSKDTDIFCFQEMVHTEDKIEKYPKIRPNLLEEFTKILADFQVFYFPVVSGFDFDGNKVNFNLSFGQATFIKNSITVISQKDYIINKEGYSGILKKDFSNLPTPLQYIRISINNKEFAIFNFHGTPLPGNKLDTIRRLKESRVAKKIIDEETCAKIVVGDFNLLPQTRSIKIFTKNLTNLITQFQIATTRSTLSPFWGTGEFQKFADYTLVSPNIKVINFQVPNIPISDHLPMILQFNETH